MLKIILILITTMCILPVAVLQSAADTANMGPQVFIPESIYEFQPVVEGTQVVHAFAVENHGNTPLVILEIKTD